MKEIIEEWKLIHIVTKPQKYYARGTKLYISNLGRCKANENIIELKPKKNKYLYFLNTPLHRLVYQTFIGEIPNGYDIDHLNRDRQDNRVCNLRACTRSENMNNPNTLKILHQNRTRKSYIEFQRNNNIGRIWINNGEKRSKIFPENLDEYLNNGWKLGWKL